MKSERVSSISYRRKRQSELTTVRELSAFHLQQEGDEEAIILFFIQKPQFGSEKLMDPEGEESNSSCFLSTTYSIFNSFIFSPSVFTEKVYLVW